MLVRSWMTWAEDASRCSTSSRQSSSSHLPSGAVMLTSQSSSRVMHARRCRGRGGSPRLRVLAGGGEGGVAADDRPGVGEEDPAAFGVFALGVEREEHGALGADVAVGVAAY